jgi:hypothetical protein
LVVGAIKASPTDRELFVEVVKRTLDCRRVEMWEERKQHLLWGGSCSTMILMGRDFVISGEK